jgi:hypothetical protein
MRKNRQGGHHKYLPKTYAPIRYTAFSAAILRPDYNGMQENKQLSVLYSVIIFCGYAR